MVRRWLKRLAATVAVLGLGVTSTAPGPAARTAVALQDRAHRPVSFTQNNGQWDDRVLFCSRATGGALWITRDGAYYQFTRRRSHGDDTGRPQSDQLRFGTDSLEFVMARASLVGANPSPNAIGGDALEYRCNYFVGSNPSQWRTDVPNFGSVVLPDVYPGIDQTYYGNGSGIEEDFIVRPGADPSQIRIRYDGATSLRVNESGGLTVDVGWGQVTEQAPMIYQVAGGEHRPVSGAYDLSDGNTVGFRVSGAFDRTLPLVIDPALHYSTYLGGSDFEAGYYLAVDSTGSVYVTGNSESINFPVVNAYDGSFNGGSFGDVFLTKLSPDGDTIRFSTYIGGAGSDLAAGIALNGAGHIYLVGATESGTTFPLLNAYDASYNGTGDLFITKLAPSGNVLEYSTFLGGFDADYGKAITVDGSGNAFVTGYTHSTDFPMVGAYDATYNGGASDAFVAKLSSGGNLLLYSTYLGGSGDDAGYGVAVNAAGKIFVEGWTASTDFPVHNAFDATFNGGEKDIFVSKLSGATLDYSTYLGGTDSEYGLGFVIDAAGDAYIAGATRSSEFPVANAYDATLGGLEDLFVTKLSPTGNSLVYSTFLGGSAEEFDGLVAVDSMGGAYVTGYTYSPDFPTLNAYDPTYNLGSDVVLARLSPAGNALTYGTFLGGSGYEFANTVALDKQGAIYLTGVTNSTDFPIAGGIDATLSGSYDAFITKFNADNCSCSCHADPKCDGQIDVLDVVGIINVAFRGFLQHDDPDCPKAREDVDCNGFVDIVDVVKMVNVAFRGLSTASQFCNACA